jgi:hypothetical protein
MNVEAISVTPTLNFQSLIIVPESLPFGEKDPSCSSLPRVKQRAQNWYLLYLRAHPRSMLNNASHAQGERAVDRIVAHAIVSNVSTFRLFSPLCFKPNAKAMLMKMMVRYARTARVI